MSDGTRDDKGASRSAEEAALSARLRSLGERLDQVGPGRSAKPGSASGQSTDYSGLARGMRLSAELVGGVAVGFVLGWVLDRVLGTSPWGMIVFLLLGFVAGVLNVMRSAGVIKPGPLDGNQRN